MTSSRRFEKGKGAILALVFAALLLKGAPAMADLSMSPGSGVRLQADTLEYLRDEGLVMARGSVHIQQDSVNLYAENIRYDINAQEVQADGNVVWQDGTQEIRTQSLTYNLKTQEGKAKNIRTTSPPWIVTGEELQMTPHKVVVKAAKATTCDYAEGYTHFHMQADKITIYSGNFLVAENMVLYIGKVPVFYFPFFVKNLTDIKTPFSVSAGQTDYLSNYVLATTNYLFTPQNYGAVYADYFFKRGLGLGVRHEIALNDYSVLSLYGYGIQEKGDNEPFRWESRIRGLWALSSNFQGRIEADIPGDGFFSQNYSVARRDPSLVTTLREFDLSGTYSTPQWTLSALARRRETADPTDPKETRFLENLETLPQVAFTLFPQRIIGKNWIKMDLNLQGDHTWTKANNFYVNHLRGGLGLSQSVLFAQTQTLFSRFSLDEVGQDRADLNQTNAGETHSLSFNNTWTARWTEFLNSSFTYSLAQKLNNLTAQDQITKGVSSNLLTGSLEVADGSLLRARTSTSLNFNAQVGDLASRFSFLRQEFYLTPSPRIDYLVITDYSVKANALKDLSTVLNFRSSRDLWRLRVSGNFVDPNVLTTGNTNAGLPSSFTVSSEITFAFFTNYRISALETYDLTNARFQTRNISLYRDLHDWEAELNYSEDAVTGKRLFFTLNLKAFPGRPLTVSDEQLQRVNDLRNQGLTGAADQFQ